MNTTLEFNAKFDNEDYILSVLFQNDTLRIDIEHEAKSVYWHGEFNANAIKDITSKMGSFKSIDVFVKMLICALSNESENITINFVSFNEIQRLSDNKSQNLNYSNSNINSTSINKANDIKKYLMLVYTQFEKVVYPLPLIFLNDSPPSNIMQRTIARLKKKISEQGAERSNYNNDSNLIVNYTEYERLKKDNANLISKVKLLESARPLGAVDNDDIYKRYNDLNEEFAGYKAKSDAKIKMLIKTLDELKEANFRDSKSSFNETAKTKSKIADLEQKLQIASDIVVSERKQGQIFIDEKNKQIELLKKEIKALKDNEKLLKVKITKLEKDLELANRSSNYYRYGTPKGKAKSVSNRSYKQNSYTNSYSSGFSSEAKSKKSSNSYLRKNLVPDNPYNKFHGLRGKNYKPFSFMKDKKKTTSYSKSSKNSSASKSIASKSSSKKKYNVPSKVFSKPKVSSLNKKKSYGTNNNKNIYGTKKNYNSTVNYNKSINISHNIGISNNTVTNNNLKRYDGNTMTNRIEKIQSLINQASMK